MGGDGEVRVVEQIEELRPDRKLAGFHSRNLEALQDTHVRIRISGSVEVVPATSGERGSRAKVGGVEAGNASSIRFENCGAMVWYCVSQLLGQKDAGKSVPCKGTRCRCVSDRERESGVVEDRARHFPAVGEHPRAAFVGDGYDVAPGESFDECHSRRCRNCWPGSWD